MSVKFHRTHVWLAALVLIASWGLPSLATANDRADWTKRSRLMREEGALYLEDFLPRGEKLRVPVGNNSMIYYKPDFARYLGTLRTPQKVEVVAVLSNGKAFRVRGRAQQGDVVGWVAPETLPELPKTVVEDLVKAGERYELVQQLIEDKAVAPGMTMDEVEQSLGRPEKRSSRVSSTGRTAEWQYVTYEMVPQQVTGRDQFGRLVTTTQYVKVPTGRLTVQFKDDVAEAIERSEGIDDSVLGSVKYVAPPVILRW